MNLLGAKNYDPTGGAAVSKVTTSLLAMTALDTTNLRIAFTIPAHGFVTVKLTGVHHGSTTIAQVMLGVLEGSTLRGRQISNINILQTAVATSMVKLEVMYTLSGLTPGAVNWDAAYGVEIVSSAGGALKYGGPNNTTTNDGFGGFNFEVWDPQPLKLALDGGVNVTQFGGSAGTFSGGRPEVNTSHAAGTAWGSGAITAASIAADAITAAKIADGAIDAATFAAGAINAAAIAADAIGASELAADAVTEIANAVWDTDATGRQTQGSFGQAIGDPGADTDTIWGLANTNLDAAVSSRMATYVQPTGFLAATFPATVASTTNITAGTITTATNVTTVNGLAANVITAAATAADFTTEIQAGLATAAALATVDGIVDDILLDTAEIGVAGAGLTNINLPNQTMDIVGNITGNLSGSVGSVTGAVGSVTGNVGGNVVGSVASVVGAVGSVTGLTASNLDATISSRASAANLATVAGYLDTEIAQIMAKTDNLPSDPADASVVAGLIAALETKVDTIDGIVDTILVDTNELQTDWVNGGRLDLILDSRSSQTSVDDNSTKLTDILSLVESIAITGTATYIAADSSTLVTGVLSSGTYDSTSTADGVYHVHTDTAGAIEVIYDFDEGVGETGVELLFRGRVNSANDSILVQVYDWIGADWETIWTQVGVGGSVDTNRAEPLLTKHTGTGVDDGRVRIRFYAAAGLSSATLYVDQLLVARAADTLSDEILAIKAKTDNLPSDPADASVVAGLIAGVDTAIADLPTNAELATALAAADDAVLAQVALVKAKTDNLPSDPADASDIVGALVALEAHGDAAWATATGFSTFNAAADDVLANVKKVNSITVIGSGTLADPWGPAP